MKKQKIKALPVVKAFRNYFINRAKRVLKLTKKEYDSFHIDYMHGPDAVEIWFFHETGIVAWVTFTHDGCTKSIDDKRKKK